MPNLPHSSVSSSSEWPLDKILPPSQLGRLLAIMAIALALLAIFISGLSLVIKLVCCIVLAVAALISHRYSVRVRAISIDRHHCRLRLNGHRTVELVSPFKSTNLHWWIGIQQQDRFSGKWYWLYRDQFSMEEWRQLAALVKWA